MIAAESSAAAESVRAEGLARSGDVGQVRNRVAMLPQMAGLDESPLWHRERLWFSG